MAALAAAGGCAAVGGGTVCTDMAAIEGVSLSVAPSEAAEVESGTMELCRGGDCEEHDLRFRPETTSVDEGCDDGACSARAEPTGGLTANVQMDRLTTDRMDVHIELRDSGGEELFSGDLTTAAETSYPNGPDCGAGPPQLGLKIEDGSLQKRG
ncbi:hypothetical protein [Nocardiopsis suaedae]|uniref:Lipoprotein n=1 Tax=Nocardiopsis suaedae TaxID=3018444 RepID=A0ABT4TVG1_9ACTN|nr:hypothetical protein [Nocardiopsis suaedae]MDA2808697.1 hypothetical protein [Nocardiopsis suaedae]